MDQKPLFGVAFKAVAVTGELAGKAPVVIGRGMKDNVRPFAKLIGGEVFETTAKTSVGKLIQNTKWMLNNVIGDREIIDIGGNLFSRYYVVEKIIKYLWKPIW